MAPPASFFFTSSGLAETVPDFGLGIRPFGPRILANLASLGIMAGVATRTSKSRIPSLILPKVLSEAISTFASLPVP